MKPHALAALALAVLWASFGVEFRNASLTTQCQLAVLGGAAALVVIERSSPRRFWTSGFWFALALAVFHLGIAMVLALGLDLPEAKAKYVTSWFNDHAYTGEALYAASVALAAFAVGYTLIAPRRLPEQDRPPTGPGRQYTALGFLLLLVGALWLMYFVVETAPDLLFGGSRTRYLDAIAGHPPQTLGSALAAFGTILLAAGEHNRTRRNGLVVAGLFTTWALLVGDRTISLYMVVAAVIVVARLRPMPRARVAVGLVLLGTVLVGVIGQVRIAGLNPTSLAQASLDLRQPVTEMGGSLRPVVEEITLSESLGQPAKNGSTYTVFARRQLERALGEPRPEGTADSRYAGSELQTRTEGLQIGYSAVAEAYTNWRIPGVWGVFLVFGALLSWLDHKNLAARQWAALTGFIFYALLYTVRQPSNVTLFTIGSGVALLLLVKVLGRGRPEDHPLDQRLERSARSGRV